MVLDVPEEPVGVAGPADPASATAHITRDHRITIVMLVVGLGLLLATKVLRGLSVAYMPVRYGLEIGGGFAIVAAFVFLFSRVRADRNAFCLIVAAVLMLTANRVLQLDSVARLGMDATGLTRRAFDGAITDNTDVIGVWLVGLALAASFTAAARAEQQLATHRDSLEALVERRTRELKASHEKLRHAERLAAVGTLAAGIAHEINNPIGAMLTAARTGLRTMNRPNPPVSTERVLETVVEEANRCGRIVKSLLQFARQRETDKWPTKPNEVAGRAVEITRRDATNRAGTIELTLGKNLPDLTLNPVAIEQVLINLIQNALQAGGANGPVTVETRAVRDDVQFTVSDQGPGISADVRKHLFDPFFTTHPNEGGTGLGLSVVHGIVTEHRGTITVESELGQGTTFTVTLPVAPARDT